MHIKSLWLNTAPFADYLIEFSQGVNIVRGKNGTGKTTILEALALVGHTPVLCYGGDMRREDMRAHTLMRLMVEVVLSEADASFLHQVAAQADQGGEVAAYARRISHALPETSGRFWTSQALQRLKGWLATVPREVTLTVGVAVSPSCFEGASPELKLSLTSEHRLRKDWVCVADEEVHFLALGLLLSTSRPEEISCDSTHAIETCVLGRIHGSGQSRRWNEPLRVGLLDRLQDELAKCDPVSPDGQAREHRELSLPGLISYINTDMYQFGVGLDIRESPKELNDDLTLVLAERLQLLRSEPALQPESSQATYRLRAFEQIQRAWSRVFDVDRRLQSIDGPAYSDEGSGRLKHCDLMFDATSGKAVWKIEIGKERRSFFSSGENQVFFLLTLTNALRPTNSCLLVDEPELHMSLGGASMLFDYLFEFARDSSSQVVIVTHVPYLFTARTKRGEARVILVDLHEDLHKPFMDGDAIRRLSHQQARNVAELFSDIQLDADELSFQHVFFGPSAKP